MHQDSNSAARLDKGIRGFMRSAVLITPQRLYGTDVSIALLTMIFLPATSVAVTPLLLSMRIYILKNRLFHIDFVLYDVFQLESG